MSREIIFKRLARIEFDEAIAWYEEREKRLGARFEAEVNTTLERVRRNPEHFPKVTESVHKARVHVFTDYTVFFAATENRIGVVSIFHGARNPDELKRRLK